MVKRINWFIVCMLFSIGVTAQAAGKQYNSYKGLVMAGYQGWFNAGAVNVPHARHINIYVSR